MKRRLLKTMAALLAIAAAAAGPVRGQNSYNVTFGGFGNDQLNTMYEDQSLPLQLTFDAVDIAEQLVEVYEAYVDDGAGMQEISVSYTSYTVTVTINSAFNGTATIIANGDDGQDGYYEAYLYVTVVSNAPAPTPHTVRMAEGTVEAANWSLASGGESVQGTQVLENVMSGSELTATYNGTQKVKSVKAVKYVAPAATVTTAPTATGATIEVGSTAALVSGGAANGGTMMYAVTATNVQPASTADFSATIPTAEGREAGTYYVWYYAKADANHSDSEIAGPVSVTLVAITTITWTSSDMTSNFYAQFDGWSYNSTHQGITVTASGDANGGWSGNNIDVHDGSGTITFTSSVGNIKSIVISAVYLNNMDMSVPTGWTASEPWNNPRTLSWSGTASATVNLPLSEMQNIGSISTIVFTLE